MLQKLLDAFGHPYPHDLQPFRMIATLCVTGPASRFEVAVKCLVKEGIPSLELLERWARRCADSPLLANPSLAENLVSTRTIFCARWSDRKGFAATVKIVGTFFERRFGINDVKPTSTMLVGSKKSTAEYSVRTWQSALGKLPHTGNGMPVRGYIRLVIAGIDGCMVDIQHWINAEAMLRQQYGLDVHLVFYLNNAAGFSPTIPLREIIADNGPHGAYTSFIRSRWEALKRVRHAGVWPDDTTEIRQHMSNFAHEYSALETRGRNGYDGLPFVLG